MMAKTHLVTSMSGGISILFLNENITSFLFESQLIIYYLAGVVFGSLFPDIDETNSYIGSRLKPIAFLVNNLFGHRGFTHRFLLVIILASIGFVLWKIRFPMEYVLFIIGMTLGVLFHQIGDMLIGSPRYHGGVKDYFYPFVKKRGKRTYLLPRFLRGTIGGFTEYIYLIISMLVIIGEVYLIMGGKFVI